MSSEPSYVPDVWCNNIDALSAAIFMVLYTSDSTLSIADVLYQLIKHNFCWFDLPRTICRDKQEIATRIFLAWMWEEALCGSLTYKLILCFCTSTAVFSCRSWNGLAYLHGNAVPYILSGRINLFTATHWLVRIPPSLLPLRGSVEIGGR